MGEQLDPYEIANLPFSRNPYLRALQAANRIGLLGVRIEDVERTFPLGEIDVLCVASDLDITSNQPSQEEVRE